MGHGFHGYPGPSPLPLRSDFRSDDQHVRPGRLEIFLSSGRANSAKLPGKKPGTLMNIEWVFYLTSM
jgi:hypothetical protein